MNLNNKGFAISTVLYSLLIMATLILFLLIGNLSFERRTTNELVSNIQGELNSFAEEYGTSSSVTTLLSEILLAYVGDNGGYYDDGTDTFITGENPNNYIWYSGKLWRAVSVNNAEKTTKLVTQDNISSISFDDDSSAFSGSNIEMWLNDTSVDGFLGNLRSPESFIKMDSTWNATVSNGSSRPENTTTAEVAVGLLNTYEYNQSGGLNGYLNNDLDWWTLTPGSDGSSVYAVAYYRSNTGVVYLYNKKNVKGVRPAINIKSDAKIVGGSGTAEDPYRLEGDNDRNLTGTALNTRYSGEYIRMGVRSDVLYRIVSHETEKLTKITTDKSLTNTIAYGSTPTFRNSTIYMFLNGYIYSSYFDYFTDDEINMISDNTVWYQGMVAEGNNYRLSKYTDIDMSSLTTSVVSAKVGLLRMGELMSSQQFTSSSEYDSNSYWLITPVSSESIYCMNGYGNISTISFRSSGGSTTLSAKPAFNLKENVIITGGDGTKENPFTLSVQ